MPELSVIIPAHNEADCIAATIRVWSAELVRLGLTHEILVYDDGSTDSTLNALTNLRAEVPTLDVTHQANRGHGPTILTGYRAAQAEWVFQVDGDDEVGAGPFEQFWEARERYDFLIGMRRGRTLGLPRRLLSAAARGAIAILFGHRLSDVNCPYRLMRRSMLTALIRDVPPDTFAPNVAIAGLASAAGYRLLELEVPSRPQPHRPPARWGVLAVGWLSLTQLMSIARRARTRSGARAQRTT